MMTQPGSPKLDLRSVLYERAFGRLVDPPQPDVVFRFHVGLGTRAFFVSPLPLWSTAVASQCRQAEIV